jgi:hypothetical protein
MYLDPCRKTFDGAVHRSEVYSAELGSKDLALLRFPVIDIYNLLPRKAIMQSVGVLVICGTPVQL